MKTQSEHIAPQDYGTNRATYSPEDNKLRLYVGRVPREEFLKLRAEGWKTLHKQREAGGGDFVATWTPERRDTALEYAGIIEDEDMGPAERAADRAERFSGYRDKRTAEACGHADRYDAGPAAHGYQSQARADRAAARHDRIADRAGDAWSKAEYWTQRTAGVIAHALYKSTPGVRMGRIKEIEAELRKLEKSRDEATKTWRQWEEIAAMPDAEKQTNIAEVFAGYGYGWHHYKHPRTGKEGSLWDFLRQDAADRITGAEAAALYFAAHTSPDSPAWLETRTAQWINHCKMRIAYELQMCEAAGGRAADVEMIPGGWLGDRQIRKVVKSPVTGRVVSVEVMGTRRGFTRESGYKREETRAVPVLVNIERAGADCYRPPTDEELAAFLSDKKAEKDAAPKVQFINPTPEDAERLQQALNQRAKETDKGRNYPRRAGEIEIVTQAKYSGHWTDGKCTSVIGGVKLRFMCYGWQNVESVVVLSDKPQKPLPASIWEAFKPAAPVSAEAVAV